MSTRRPALVDAHVHLWDLDALSYPWLSPPFSDTGVNGDVSAIAHSYQLHDYLADAHSWSVEGLVHVEAGAAPNQALAETRALQAIADAAPFPIALVVYAALDAPDIEAWLDAHVQSRAVRGVRQILNWHADPARTYTSADLLVDDGFARGFGRLAVHDLSFDLQIYPPQMAAAARLAAAHPRTRLVLNHAGMPCDRSDDGFQVWRAGMRALAAQDNVSVKLSGFGLVDRGWTTHSIRSLILETIDLFGVDRAMFASDAPTDKLFAPFDRIMNAYDEISAAFTDEERRALFSQTALSTYRIGGSRG